MNLGPLIIGNPLGLWALLGVPLLVLIHFLQRKVRHIPVSTGFLLDHINFQSPQGSRFEKFRSSVPFWLQLLAVLLLAAILSQLGWRNAKPLRRIAIVLDGSASMQVATDRVSAGLNELLTPLAEDNRLDITLTTSDSSRTTLYRGDSLENAVASLNTWQPIASDHDPADALRTARALIGTEGALLYATDHAPAHQLPYSAKVLATGEPMGNVGITSVRLLKSDTKGNRFTAMVHNFSNEASTRQWTVTYLDSGNQTTPREIKLDPNGTVRVEGALPPNTTRAVVSLSHDQFTIDDAAPIIIPARKRIDIAADKSIDPKALEFWQRIAKSLDGATWTDSDPDLIITTVRPTGKASANLILHLPAAAADTPLRTDAITSASHPLVDGLNWQALTPRRREPLAPGLRPNHLLWQGDVPLAWTEQTGNFEELVLNLNPQSAAGTSDPSLIVLAARFIERVRDRLPHPETLLTETNAPLKVVAPPAEKAANDNTPELFEWRLTAPDGSESRTWLERTQLANLTAPPIASWFSLSTESGAPLVDGAAIFADTREMDFTAAASITDFDPESISELPTGTDHTPAGATPWILVTLAVLLLVWYFSREKAPPQTEPDFLRS